MTIANQYLLKLDRGALDELERAWLIDTLACQCDPASNHGASQQMDFARNAGVLRDFRGVQHPARIFERTGALPAGDGRLTRLP